MDEAQRLVDCTNGEADPPAAGDSESGRDAGIRIPSPASILRRSSGSLVEGMSPPWWCSGSCSG